MCFICSHLAVKLKPTRAFKGICSLLQPLGGILFLHAIRTEPANEWEKKGKIKCHVMLLTPKDDFQGN